MIPRPSGVWQWRHHYVVPGVFRSNLAVYPAGCRTAGRYRPGSAPAYPMLIGGKR